MTASRKEVYEAIDGERAYQEQKWPGHQHSLLEWLVYIDDYSAEAKRFASRNPDPIAADFLRNAARKIAALAVAGLEQNGVRTREQEGGRLVGQVA